MWSERKAACGFIAMVRFHTAPRRLGPIHTIQGLYVNLREPIFSRLYRKEERQKKYRQSDNLIVPMRGDATGGKGITYAISEKETFPIHRDWYDKETDFKEKSVGYTELGYD